VNIGRVVHDVVAERSRRRIPSGGSRSMGAGLQHAAWDGARITRR
jgi:hypothetical protein